MGGVAVVIVSMLGLEFSISKSDKRVDRSGLEEVAEKECDRLSFFLVGTEKELFLGRVVDDEEPLRESIVRDRVNRLDPELLAALLVVVDKVDDEHSDESKSSGEEPLLVGSCTGSATTGTELLRLKSCRLAPFFCEAVFPYCFLTLRVGATVRSHAVE